MYEQMTNEEIAQALAEALGIDHRTALRAVISDDPDLGRKWATSILRRAASYEHNQARLSEYQRSLRSVAASG
jgi:phosphoserine phosphatase